MPTDGGGGSKERLECLLREILRLESSDLDFGMYRILALRRQELERFLQDDLLPQISTTLAAAADAEQAVHLAEEVYSDLYRFFSRYSVGGEILARPRLRGDTYALPYDGREVKLHYAAAEQHYVKSSESHADYRFPLRVRGCKEAWLRLRVTGAEAELNDNRAAEARRYVLRPNCPVEVQGSVLSICFEYRVPQPGRGRQPGQQALLADAEGAILEAAPAPFREALASRDPKGERSVLAACLGRYLRRRSSDFFVHRDLAGFLHRELEHFVKTEVLRLDELEGRTGTALELDLRKAAALRGFAAKIIDWLGAMEDFALRLYTRPKLVLSSELCVSLSLVPEALWNEVLASVAQVVEWKRLFGVDAPVGIDPDERRSFVQQHPGLFVRTRHFAERFVWTLRAALEEQPQGILVHGDNLQAARLLEPTFAGRVHAVYLDPPYNTSEETFVYKNDYRHSSWLAMMRDRLEVVDRWLADEGVVLVAIDDAEVAHLRMLLDEVFGAERYLGTIVVVSNPRGRSTNAHFATSHEYLLTYGLQPERAKIVDSPLSAVQRAVYRDGTDDRAYRLLPFRRSGGLSTPAERPHSEYSLYFSPGAGRIVAVGGEREDPYPAEYVEREVLRLEGKEVVSFARSATHLHLPADVRRLVPRDSEGARRVWRWADRRKVLEAAARGDLVVEGERVRLKDFVKAGRKPRTVWQDPRYDAAAHGTNLLKDMLGERRAFGYPKSIHAVRDALHAVVGDHLDAVVVDLFAGSGTTAQAVMELNRQDGGRRRFVLAEMGEYFESVTLTRVLRAAYAERWDRGVPGHPSHEPWVLEVLEIESYDDALENVALNRSSPVAALLREQPGLREEYLLRYLFDQEGTQLDLDGLRRPWSYSIRVRRQGVVTTSRVDLVETFHRLLGLQQKRYHPAREPGLILVTGTLPAGQRVVIVWRDCDVWPSQRLEAHCATAFPALGADELDIVYVNGDQHLAVIRGPDARWRVLLIEEVFREAFLRSG